MNRIKIFIFTTNEALQHRLHISPGPGGQSPDRDDQKVRLSLNVLPKYSCEQKVLKSFEPVEWQKSVFLSPVPAGWLMYTNFHSLSFIISYHKSSTIFTRLECDVTPNNDPIFISGQNLSFQKWRNTQKFTSVKIIAICTLKFTSRIYL